MGTRESKSRVEDLVFCSSFTSFVFSLLAFCLVYFAFFRFPFSVFLFSFSFFLFLFSRFSSLLFTFLQFSSTGPSGRVVVCVDVCEWSDGRVRMWMVDGNWVHG